MMQTQIPDITNGWFEWRPVTDSYCVAPKSAGVYCVRATTSTGEPTPISRALAVDPDGIVYFGEGILVNRIGSLSWISNKEHSSHQQDHPLIWTWDNYNLDRLADRTLLQVKWKVCDNHEAEEAHLLDEYKKTFGDIPPGNRKIALPDLSTVK